MCGSVQIMGQQVPVKARRGPLVLRSYRKLLADCLKFCGPNLDPLREQHMLLTTEANFLLKGRKGEFVCFIYSVVDVVFSSSKIKGLFS